MFRDEWGRVLASLVGFLGSTSSPLSNRASRRGDEARAEYELAHSEPERRFLQRRIAQVGA